jgi:hypothetical protein
MDAVSRSHAVNWSAEVHPLFEAKVAVLERSPGERTAVIRRLRESKMQVERQRLIQGRIDAREWVESRAEYEALKRLKKNSGGYQSAWDRPWEQLRCAVDPFGQFTDDQVSAHFFGEGVDDHHPYYLSAFLASALETWDELEPEVETAYLSAADQANAVAPVVPAEAPKTPETSSALPAPDVRASSGPLTDHLPASGRRDAVTLALAEFAEAPERPPDNYSSPQARPKLWIVRVAEDTYTNAREWLARERPIDYGD